MFDGRRLAPVTANSPISNPMPVTAFTFVAEEPAGAPAGTGDSKAGTVVVPLYLSDTREALLTELQLPCVEGAARWILAGLAAVCGAAQ